MRDHHWFAGLINRSPKWVLEHIDEIPHRMVGRSPMFLPEDYAAYAESIKRDPGLMRTTGPRRKRSSK